MQWQGLERRVNSDPTISRFSTRSTFRCLIDIGEDEWMLAMTDGAMAPPAHGPFVMPQCDFALRGTAAAWARFSRDKAAPGDQDIFAFFRRREMSLTGDTRMFYAHLIVLKLMLAHLRDSE